MILSPLSITGNQVIFLKMFCSLVPFTITTTYCFYLSYFLWNKHADFTTVFSAN